MSNFVYIVEFDMKTPMLSQRHVPDSLKISSDMIKVGKVNHPRPFEDRMRDYEGTFKCVRCNKSHFSIVEHWELPEYKNPDDIESIIKSEFSSHRISTGHEYYESKIKHQIRTRLSELVQT